MSTVENCTKLCCVTVQQSTVHWCLKLVYFTYSQLDLHWYYILNWIFCSWFLITRICTTLTEINRGSNLGHESIRAQTGQELHRKPPRTVVQGSAEVSSICSLPSLLVLIRSHYTRYMAAKYSSDHTSSQKYSPGLLFLFWIIPQGFLLESQCWNVTSWALEHMIF